MPALFVKKISWAVTNLELLQHFSKYGPVLEVVQFYDKMSGKSFGEAKINFKDEESMIKALNDKHKFYSKLAKVRSPANDSTKL